MILAAFMVLLILWFSEGIRSISLISDAQKHQTQSADSKIELERLHRMLAEAQMQIVRLKQKPPIITLDEAQNYRFETGSAALSPQFRDLLEAKVLPQLKDIFGRYPVNTIEIIGHTDSQPAGAKASNLDTHLMPVIDGAGDIASLVFGSNADLGLMRAVAIRLALEKMAGAYGLESVRFRTYSAAQTATPKEQNVASGLRDDRRRRIEIRFTRSED